MTTVSDLIVEKIYKYGVNKVFGVVGGMSIHLTDAIAKQDYVQFIPMHGEAGAAWAAYGYAAATGVFGVAYTTAGCGVTNAITPVLSAYQDSIPMVIVSGQERADRSVVSIKGCRTHGVQDMNSMEIVKEFATPVLINSAEEAKCKVESVLLSAMSGRKKPVWFFIPLDVQRTSI